MIIDLLIQYKKILTRLKILKEIDDGYILCCQASPTSDNVEIEVD